MVTEYFFDDNNYNSTSYLCILTYKYKITPQPLINDSSPIIVADSPLLNDYAPDFKLNNSTPQPVNTHVLIVIDRPDSLDSPVSNDTTLVLIENFYKIRCNKLDRMC